MPLDTRLIQSIFAYQATTAFGPQLLNKIDGNIEDRVRPDVTSKLLQLGDTLADSPLVDGASLQLISDQVTSTVLPRKLAAAGQQRLETRGISFSNQTVPGVSEFYENSERNLLIAKIRTFETMPEDVALRWGFELPIPIQFLISEANKAETGLGNHIENTEKANKPR